MVGVGSDEPTGQDRPAREPERLEFCQVPCGGGEDHRLYRPMGSDFGIGCPYHNLGSSNDFSVHIEDFSHVLPARTVVGMANVQAYSHRVRVEETMDHP